MRKFWSTLVLMLLFVLGATWLPQSASESNVTLVSGTWASAGAVTFTSFVPAGPNARITGFAASKWSGQVAGNTTFTARVLQLARSGVLRGQLLETFTGSVQGVGSGTLTFVEQFVQNTTTGVLTISAEITDGTGALSSLRGALHFTGGTDARGLGDGAYTSRFTTSL